MPISITVNAPAEGPEQYAKGTVDRNWSTSGDFDLPLLSVGRVVVPDAVQFPGIECMMKLS